MAGGKGKIKPEDGKQFSSEYQPDKEIWTEVIALSLLNDLILWLKEIDEDGEDKGNIFFEEFIFLVANPEKYHPKAKIYADLLVYLSNKFTSCFELLERAKKIQEIKLIKYGCADRLNSTMTKFVLSAHHGLSEKTRQEITANQSVEFKNSPFAKLLKDEENG